MKKLATIFIIFMCFEMNAQKIIFGKVVDEFLFPLQGAIIRVTNSSVTSISDKNGCFSIQVPEIGFYNYLTVSYTGYTEKIILINSYHTDTIFIKLQTEEYNEGYIVKKPVIYIYPNQKMTINIKVKIDGQLLHTYPRYDEGWNVIAEPNGILTDINTKKQYKYLFWDAKIFNKFHIENIQGGFVVENTNTTKFLDSILSIIGLNQFEINDFITYWLPSLSENKYNMIKFLINEECDEIAKISITPPPNKIIRVYMFFYPLNSPVIIENQQIKKTKREGYVAVEWGGAMIDY